MPLVGHKAFCVIAWIVAQNKFNPSRLAETICFFCNTSYSILGNLLHANKRKAALGYFLVNTEHEHGENYTMKIKNALKKVLASKHLKNLREKSRVLGDDRRCLKVATQSVFSGKQSGMRSTSAERGEASRFQRELPMRFPRRGVSRSQTLPAQRPACSLHNVLIPSSHWNLMTN